VFERQPHRPLVCGMKRMHHPLRITLLPGPTNPLTCGTISHATERSRHVENVVQVVCQSCLIFQTPQLNISSCFVCILYVFSLCNTLRRTHSFPLICSLNKKKIKVRSLRCPENPFFRSQEAVILGHF